MKKKKRAFFYNDRSDQFKFQVIFKIKTPNKVILLLLLLLFVSPLYLCICTLKKVCELKSAVYFIIYKCNNYKNRNIT
jgi:hypothetical protein